MTDKLKKEYEFDVGPGLVVCLFMVLVYILVLRACGGAW